MNSEDKKNKSIIKKLLAQHLGVESDDISEDDILKEDLHMGPVELTDFALKLSEKGFSTENIDFNEIETLEDLYEALL